MIRTNLYLSIHRHRFYAYKQHSNRSIQFAQQVKILFINISEINSKVSLVSMHTTTVLLLFASFQAQMHTNTTRIVLDFYILTIGDAISCWCVEHLVDMKII